MSSENIKLVAHHDVSLFGQRNQVFAQLLGELDIVPLDDVAPADLVHDIIPVV